MMNPQAAGGSIDTDHTRAPDGPSVYCAPMMTRASSGETARFCWPILVAALLAPAGLAQAHGRPPFIGELRFHPTDPMTMVARATWGLVLTTDGGESWSWICATVTGADPTREDPAIHVTNDGAVLVGTFNGLARSTSDRCEFVHPAPELENVYVIDVFGRRSEADTVYAIVTSGGGDDFLYRSTDAGMTFEALGEPFGDGLLLERVRVAPSDGDVVYLSGAIPQSTPDSVRRAFFLRSADAGLSFVQTEVPLEDGERNLHLLDVDPTDPMRALVRVTRRITDTRPERVLLTEDGGATFVTAGRAPEVSDGAFTRDGTGAYVTSADVEGLFVSDDAGRTFTATTPGNFRCVETRGDELWLCAYELRDGYSLGRSQDGGETIEEELGFAEIFELPPCGGCTSVGYICPEWFPDLASDLRLVVDASLPDAATGAPRDAAAPDDCDIDAGPRPDSGPRPDGGIDNAMDAGPQPGMDGGPNGAPTPNCGCVVSTRSSAPTSGGLMLAGLALLGLRRRLQRR